MKPPAESPHNSDNNRVRPFTLLDAMSLIAAFAACCVVHRTFRMTLPTSTYKSYVISEYVLIHLGAWLLAFSLALAASVALLPQPGGWERFRQPGALALLMVGLTWAFNVIQVAARACFIRLSTGQAFDDPAFWWLFGPIREVPPRAGLAVLAAWSTLALIEAGRPSKNWLDRSGRALGWTWIAWGMLVWSSELLTLFLSNNNRVLKP